MQIKVRALPAPGHIYRRRIGRTFSKDWTVLDVVDHPSKPDEISPLQYKELQADNRITAIPVAADDAGALESSGKLAEAEAEIVKLRRDLAEAAERYEENARAGEAAAKASAEKIATLEGEVAKLHAELMRMAPSAEEPKGKAKK
jgi:hypothetical protein